MTIELNPTEARIIGCLIEKAMTTPDQYPLSLNALVNACNQKSNRDPVMELDERTVQQHVDALVRKHLLLERSGFGSRVPKYQHLFCNTNFGSLTFSAVATAVICELLLRGPQTPGELRTRATRISEIHDVSEVEAALTELASREDGPFVVRLPREANRRDSRYAHLFSGAVDVSAVRAIEHDARPRSTESGKPATDELSRLEQLEYRVAELRQELNELKRKLGDS